MLRKILREISSARTIHLVIIPFVIGLILMLLAWELGGRKGMEHYIGGLLLSLAFFVWGFMGLPIILRKEIPWLITIKGWFAVVEGVVLMLTAWVVAFILLGVFLSAAH